jgi:membrane fusion protein (multidrug efflux system)
LNTVTHPNPAFRPNAVPARRPWLKRAAWFGAVLLIAALVAWTRARSGAAPAGARGAGTAGGAAGAAPLRVSGVKVTPVPFVETIAANGTLRAEESIELQSEVNGKITALNFSEGKRVRAGELLVKIDDSSLQASLRRALARRELAGFREQRLARLVAEGGVSKLDYDEAHGELSVLEAEIDLIRSEIRKTEIRAPFDGLVGIRFVSLGAYVSSATRIATLQGITNLKVDFSVPERYAQRVRPGDPVRFTVAGSQIVYQGEVYAVEPRINVSTRSVLLRAQCRNPDGSLLPGIFARVEYAVRQTDAALLVPAIAVLSGLEERALFIERDGAARRILVTTGARTSREVEISSGLAAGDVVITSGLQMLRPGQPVRVQLAP